MPLGYQWSFNGTNLPGATGATLTLSNVQVSQSGNYSVWITNLYGSTNSAIAVLNVYGLSPFLFAQPASITAVEGGAASFTAGATGSSPLTYQWSFAGANLDGATNATLTLTGVEFSQAGSYTAQIANAYGSTNTVAATLTVLPPPLCAPVPAGIVGWWAVVRGLFFARTLTLMWYAGPPRDPVGFRKNSPKPVVRRKITAINNSSPTSKI